MQSGLGVMRGDGFVWAYHTPSGLLEQVHPIVDGVLSRNAALVYHPTSDRMVVFDGARTWGYHLDSDQWVQLEP